MSIKNLLNYLTFILTKILSNIFSYPAALALAASGKVNLKALVTHHFDIKETADAFNTARHGLDGAIKVMIHCQPRDANNPK